jgi:hypothetical protein
MQHVGFGWVGSEWVYLSRVGLVWGMQQVEACGHSPNFGYKGKTCGPRSVLATGVRPVILWPFITERKPRCVVMLR